VFFEGAEKKIELIVSKECSSLLDFELNFWEELVSLSQASILSKIENDYVKAFLLSESSLFVWKDRILMLTCGETKLVDSASFLISKLKECNIDCFIFQRKNEYRSYLQKTNFEEDAALLRQNLEGQSLRFGPIHGHHNLLFHTKKIYNIHDDDSTSELLMYDIGKKVSEFLTREDLCANDIREFLAVDKLLPDFIIDDFVFEPYGYSLNAIKDERYYTIHVTPQETSAYVSFETNINIEKQAKALDHFLEILSPSSFDLMTFNEKSDTKFNHNYILASHYSDKLTCGYKVNFRTYNQKDIKALSPYLLEGKN
jgi:S-adenosylmethionine decarboxylase